MVQSEVPEDEREFYVDAALTEVERRIKRTRAFVKDDDKRKTLKDVARMKASYEIDNKQRFDNIHAEVLPNRVLKVYDPAFSKERFFGGRQDSCTFDPTVQETYAELVKTLLHELRHYSTFNVALMRADPSSASAVISDKRYEEASWEMDAKDFQIKISNDIPNSVDRY